MLHTSIGYILIRTFPECMALLFIGCYMLKVNVSKTTFLKKTILLCIIQSSIRMLPINFGIHTIMGMGLVLFMLIDISKDSFINCIVALCKIFLCLILSEAIYIQLLTAVLLVPENLLVNNYSITGALYTLPSLAVLILFAFILEFIINKSTKKVDTCENE